MGPVPAHMRRMGWALCRRQVAHSPEFEELMGAAGELQVRRPCFVHACGPYECSLTQQYDSGLGSIP